MRTEELDQRFDIEQEDIMQIGVLAVLESLERIDANHEYMNEYVYMTGGVIKNIAKTKLIPSIRIGGYLPVYSASHNDFSEEAVNDRIKDRAEPIGLIAELEPLIAPGRAEDWPKLEIQDDTELEVAIAEAMTFLTARERTIVEMFYGLNGTAERQPSEIASELGITYGNAKVIKHRAIKKLRAYLEKYGPCYSDQSDVQ